MNSHRFVVDCKFLRFEHRFTGSAFGYYSTHSLHSVPSYHPNTMLNYWPQYRKNYYTHSADIPVTPKYAVFPGISVQVVVLNS